MHQPSQDPFKPRPRLPEVHVTETFNGHTPSVDCWCEPVAIYRLKVSPEQEVLVIEHEDHDIGSMHRQGVIYSRERAQDWVTVALEAVGRKENPNA